MIRSPGPWSLGPRVHANMHFSVFDANGSLVVNLGDGGKGIVEQRGNGYAIAAVMDLLKAAEKAEEALARLNTTDGPCLAALGSLREAIKKATEERPVPGVEPRKGKEPDLIVAIVCKDGRIYGDGGGPAVFTGSYRDGMDAMTMAMEHREGIRSSGNDEFCKCDDHRIIQYVPNV